jgi:hypothetical protein
LIASWPTANSKMCDSGNNFGPWSCCLLILRKIMLACQDWTNTKAAYRFLDNDRVGDAEILAGHFDATRDRVSTTAGSMRILHDTTELAYHREDGREIGHLSTSQVGSTPRLLYRKVCGMHSSLAVTPDRLPLACRWSTGSVCAGWTICGSRPRCCAIQRVVFTSAIAEVTSTNCFARSTMRARILCSALALTAVPVTVLQATGPWGCALICPFQCSMPLMARQRRSTPRPLISKRSF